MTRLVTIPFSHYCEKARWALDHHGVPYVEEGHVPVFHIRAIRRAGGTRTSPALVLDDGTVLDDSTPILEHLDRRARETGGGGTPLYPDDAADEVRALEELFDAKLGPATRRIGYFHLLKEPAVVKRIMLERVPAGERLAVRTLNPLIRAAIRRALAIDEGGVARSTERLEGVLDRVESTLADGRRYLVGDRFTAADLTFAALAAPLLFPSESPAPMPPLESMSPAIRAVVDPLRARPAGAFGLRIYREHRPASAAHAA